MLIIVLGLIAKLTMVSSDCKFGIPKLKDIIWIKAANRVLTRFQ